MSKVIDIKTRQEITQLPLTTEEGEKILNHLMHFEPKTDAEAEIMKNIMKMVENNSGVNFFDYMWNRAGINK